MARGQGLKKPVQPDEILGDIVGHRPLPRTEITKKLWSYIKKNRLQDADDGRIIVADGLLQEFFNGAKEADMLDLAGYVSDHILR